MAASLQEAAGQAKFEEQFLAGVAAAMRAFGPPVGGRTGRRPG